jgi:hypothetical protein
MIDKLGVAVWGAQLFPVATGEVLEQLALAEQIPRPQADTLLAGA